MPFNSDETFQLWSQVGDQFLSEAVAKDKRVKEQVDFPADPPSHYPELTRPRPGLGCRMIVQRIFHHLREAIERDLRDWRSETRVKTAQLLSILVLHLEHEAVGHADHILARLQMGALDAEENVVVYVSYTSSSKLLTLLKSLNSNGFDVSDLSSCELLWALCPPQALDIDRVSTPARQSQPARAKSPGQHPAGQPPREFGVPSRGYGTGTPG